MNRYNYIKLRIYTFQKLVISALYDYCKEENKYNKIHE